MQRFFFVLICASTMTLHAADSGDPINNSFHQLEQAVLQIIEQGGTCADLEPDDFHELGCYNFMRNSRAIELVNMLTNNERGMSG
jgi:hypothetical protein